jgi:hypothetical protein
MSIRVDAYTVEGRASGVLQRPGHLREILETTGRLELTDVRWIPIDAPTDSPAADLTIAIDDLLVATSDDDTALPVHATWHAIRLEVGPYAVEGEMPTMPGFDPGRALTRPSGEFVMLRDVRLGRLGGEPPAPIGQHALVNRYDVERVEADLMLGFFFPGAAMGAAEVITPETPVPAPPVTAVT